MSAPRIADAHSETNFAFEDDYGTNGIEIKKEEWKCATFLLLVVNGDSCCPVGMRKCAHRKA
jgi:hypothetical protein